jgi:hypothetical protein
MSNSSSSKGVVDLVFLLDVSGSMQECIDAVKGSIGSFINTLSSANANNEMPVKDWRIKICGYRDHADDSNDWFVDHPFVRDVPTLLAQLDAPTMQASGGGDEPESLLDALYKVAKMEQAGAQETDLPDRWRPRGAATRVVVFFTDASFKSPMTIPEGAGGAVQDVIAAVMGSRIILCGFAPETEGYMELATADRTEMNFISREGENPVEALKALSADAGGFVKLMQQLAKTISKSAAVEAC